MEMDAPNSEQGENIFSWQSYMATGHLWKTTAAPWQQKVN